MFKLCKKSLLDVCFECGMPRSVRPAASRRGSTLAVARDGREFAGDPLDAYTDAVVSANAVKWKTSGLSSSAPERPPRRVQPTESVFESCDDPDRLIAYLRRCLDGHCVARGSVLARFMRTMARRGRVDGLALIEALDARHGGGHRRIEESAMRMSFAEAYWTNGDLSRMFETLETFYPAESAKVNRALLEPIIGTVVRSRGVAAVVMASRFAGAVAAAHGDRHPMCVLWKHLFVSELYDDNAEAERLMRRDGRLIEHVQYFVPAITNDALKKHRTDRVQRLMTVLLKHDRMKSYQWILRTLFDYHRECPC